MAGEDTSQPPPPPIALTKALQMVSSVKLHILKKGEYILWTIKMEQYLAHTDYALWEVILNGNSVVQITKDKAGNKVKVPPVNAQQILARTRERKAKSTLLMAIPDEHLARFYRIKDAKTLWAAIKSIFGGNAESKKIQRNPDIENLNIDDPYNNLKVYEADIKGSFGSSSNSQNMAFISTKSTSNTNELNDGYSVSTATGHSSQVQGSLSYADELMFLFFDNQSSSPQLDNKDLEQINQDDLEEMDLKWQLVLTKPRLNVLTVIEKGTLLGIAEQPGTQETRVEMLGMHDTEEKIMVKGLQKRRMKKHWSSIMDLVAMTGVIKYRRK
nr:ribonuclease H-like domain-containing protein [Tanacetum cinerariifolium]